MIDRADLNILLEYAYRGVAAQGGKKSCHNDRFPDCFICEALTAAEEELKADPRGEWTIDPEWWVQPWYQRLWIWVSSPWYWVKWNFPVWWFRKQ